MKARESVPSGTDLCSLRRNQTESDRVAQPVRGQLHVHQLVEGHRMHRDGLLWMERHLVNQRAASVQGVPFPIWKRLVAHQGGNSQRHAARPVDLLLAAHDIAESLPDGSSASITEAVGRTIL